MRVFILAIFAIVFVQVLSAQTSSFTYQGKLNESGNPVTSQRDLRFRLWDAGSDGAQVGGEIIVPGVSFLAGIFTVDLDFGAEAFDGTGRWIEVGVSMPGVGSYTTLGPRQRVNSVPFAVKALVADSAVIADTAANATQLGGVAAAQYVLTGDARMSDARDPLPNSGSYIQNQNAAPQASSNFDISGTGRANIFSATTQFNLGTSRVLHSPGSNLFVGRSTGTNFAGGLFNTIVGGTAGNGMITASANSFFGNGAGFDNQGSENSFFGMNAGQQNQSGGGNAFFGKDAGSANISGASNAFFGIGTGSGNTTGENLTLIGAGSNTGADGLSFATAIGAGSSVSSSNTLVLGRAADTVRVPGVVDAAVQYNIGGIRALSIPSLSVVVGERAGNSLTSGNQNVFAGYEAGSANTSGSFNSFLGLWAGRDNSSGFGNNFFGSETGRSNTTGCCNSFFGGSAGFSNQTGSYNTFVGERSAQSMVSGSNNSALGAFSVIGDALSNATALGANATASQSNSLVLGGITGVNGGTDTNVGIGTTAPKTRLEVSRGDILVGSPGQGIILKSPSGSTCVKLTIDDSPNFVGTVVPCP